MTVPSGLSRDVREPPRARLSSFDGGGPASTRLVDNAVLGTAIFVAAESMVFAGLISAFLVLRANAGEWPPPHQPRLPIAVTAVNTALLLLSAVTMWRATAAAARGRQPAVVRSLAATAALGTTFVAVQGAEWVQLLRYGLSASASVYGGTFYALIGCHGVHVLAGVITVLVVLGRVAHSARPARIRSALTACQVYWLFVVTVWPILYVLVYLA